MNNDQPTNSFSLRFSDKLTWNEFKDDLKVILRENEIKFQYSEKTPQFYVLYKGNHIEIRVTWEDDTLLFTLLAKKNLNVDQTSACHEIYDLLILFSGRLEKGTSPYEWEGDYVP
ncbi:MAG: hypothetical protein ACXAC8_06070 [Candidatus Hodarchaeales archaeon]